MGIFGYLGGGMDKKHFFPKKPTSWYVKKCFPSRKKPKKGRIFMRFRTFEPFSLSEFYFDTYP